MAFGGFTGGSTVAHADVEFVAITGKAEQDIRHLEETYTRSLGQMDTQSLRAAVAQEKLERAIARFGPQSRQAAEATVFYRRELESLNVQQNRTTKSHEAMSREVVRSGRGAIAASGAFKGLGNALFFASGAFAGAFGIVYALRSTFDAAKRSQQAIAQLAKAVDNSGISWRENRKQILNALEAQSKLSAFDDEDLKNSFSALIVRTKDVNTALKLNAIASDVARARHTSLAQATTLVVRAYNGQTAGLARVGIQIDKVTAAQDKLRASGHAVTFAQRESAKASDKAATQAKVVAELQAKFGGQAAVFAQTAAGKQEYFNKVLEDTKEVIGTALLPTFTRLLSKASSYLDNLNKSGRLQREVNHDLQQAGVVLHGVEDGLRLVKDVLKPVVFLFGGLHNTVEALIALKFASIIGGWARNMKLFKVQTAEAAIAVDGLAAAERTAAINATELAGAETAAGAAGKTGLLGLFGRLGLNPAVALPLAGAAIAAEVVIQGHTKPVSNVDPSIAAQTIIRLSTGNRDKAVALLKGITGPNRAKVIAILKQRGYGDLVNEAGLGEVQGSSGAEGGKGGRGGRPANAAAGGRGSAVVPPTRGGRGGTRSEIDIQNDISRATLAGDTASELRYNRELLEFYKRQSDALEKRKHLTLLQKQKLQQLYGEEQSAQGAIDQIIQDQTQKDKARAASRSAAAKKRIAAHKGQVEAKEQTLENALLRAAASAGTADDKKTAAALIAFYKTEAHDQELTAKERARYENKRLQVQAKLRTARAAADQKRLDLKEQRLRNAADQAELKGTAAAEKKTLKALIAFYAEESKNVDLSEKARLEAQKKKIAAQKRLKADLKKNGPTTGTRKDIMENERQFLATFAGIVRNYAPNFLPQSNGQDKTNTHLYDLKTETRMQTKHLAAMQKKNVFPASGYSIFSASAAPAV